jgi:hypothetical protein
MSGIIVGSSGLYDRAKPQNDTGGNHFVPDSLIGNKLVLLIPV